MGRFDVGVGLHACGPATDLIQARAPSRLNPARSFFFFYYYYYYFIFSFFFLCFLFFLLLLTLLPTHLPLSLPPTLARCAPCQRGHTALLRMIDLRLASAGIPRGLHARAVGARKRKPLAARTAKEARGATRRGPSARRPRRPAAPARSCEKRRRRATAKPAPRPPAASRPPARTPPDSQPAAAAAVALHRRWRRLRPRPVLLRCTAAATAAPRPTGRPPPRPPDNGKKDRRRKGRARGERYTASEDIGHETAV